MLKNKIEVYSRYLGTKEGRDWEVNRERCRDVKDLFVIK